MLSVLRPNLFVRIGSLLVTIVFDPGLDAHNESELSRQKFRCRRHVRWKMDHGGMVVNDNY